MEATLRNIARKVVLAYLENLTVDALVAEAGFCANSPTFAKEWEEMVAAALARLYGGKLVSQVAALYEELGAEVDADEASSRFDALCAIASSNRDAGFALGLELGRRLGK